MKLVSFANNGRKSIGAIVGEVVIDLQTAYKAKLQKEGKFFSNRVAEVCLPDNMVEFLQGGKESMDAAKEAVQFALKNNPNDIPLLLNKSDIKICAPILNPGKIICVGHNYRDHIVEMGRDLPTYPVLFAKFANTVIGPEDDIPFYPISEQLDYEAELAIVIGKRARNVPQETALDYVAGYTICNDVTYRDIQRRTTQFFQGKSVDGTAPMGPWIVTSDEIKDPSRLEISLSVNGEERQRSNTSNLIFTVQSLIEYLSELMTLDPGDVILTGTPGGVGVARNPQVFLKDGDIVRIEIEKMGVLQNKVKKAESN
ncbi:fumarylacetoacetate hydrolase family protein [Neobacillus citreus]|uniref:Fumarylacetoacetate hydrolase family protein n=1 Tax=Neobacillus citreus TaxID=2833578 RepID=A0A942YDQ2_9BACI|nr:fumarylacetoacetate hydrolase family protein [Neobacillus citreus]MCH6265347.1 fumarylacetoacetate hydrolase family protein [Neobacillus citreus]